jgi:hypothetical protein
VSAETPLLSRTFEVGRYRATFILPRTARAGAASTLLVEWTPDRPRDLTAAEHAAYFIARDAFVREALALMGRGRALVVS